MILRSYSFTIWEQPLSYPLLGLLSLSPRLAAVSPPEKQIPPAGAAVVLGGKRRGNARRAVCSHLGKLAGLLLAGSAVPVLRSWIVDRLLDGDTLSAVTLAPASCPRDWALWSLLQIARAIL